MKRIALLALLGLVALGVALLVQPNLVVGLRSPQALAWFGGGALVCAAVGLIAWRVTAKPRLALALAAIPAAVATAVFVVEPIVNPRELTEALPTELTALSTPSTPSSASSASSAPAVTRPSASSPAALPTASPAASPAAARPVSSAPARPTSAAAPGPARVASDELTGLAGHSAEGRVSTYRLADGSHIIRFENVDIGGTPDPEVYLLAGKDRTGKDGGLHLGALKAEKGSFNYVLPARFVGTDFTVLIWCERFAVDIAHATQA